MSAPPLPSRAIRKSLVLKTPWIASVACAPPPSVRVSELLVKVRLSAAKPVTSMVLPEVNPLMASVPSPLDEALPATVHLAPESNTNEPKLVTLEPKPAIVPALAANASSMTPFLGAAAEDGAAEHRARHVDEAPGAGSSNT